VKRAELCARLINGYVRKDEAAQLAIDDELYSDIQGRLRQVGLELVDNAFSDYYGTRQLADNPEFEEYCDHHNLQRNLAALVVLLWGKLVYPKLVAMADEKPKLEDLQGPREYTWQQELFPESPLGTGQEPRLCRVHRREGPLPCRAATRSPGRPRGPAPRLPAARPRLQDPYPGGPRCLS